MKMTAETAESTSGQRVLKVCHRRGLIGMDFSRPGVYQAFLESGIRKDTCQQSVSFTIDRLYALEEDRGLFVQAP